MKIGYDFVGITTAFFCHDGEGNLLMHKRSDKCRDEHFTWDCGSGKLEFPLSLEENVLQEVLEEYGCTGEIEEKLETHDIFREMNGVKTHWVVVPFVVRVKREEVRIGEPEKMMEYRWFKSDALPTPLHSGFAYSYENYYKKAF